MKLLEIVSKTSVVVLIIVSLFGLSEVRKLNQKSTTFYEIDGKKINIKLVKEIQARVEYVITFKEDDNSNIFKKYSTVLNDKEIENIKNFLLLAQKSEFYNVEVLAYLQFDKNTQELFHSQRYLKRASSYSVNDDMLSRLNTYGLDDLQYRNLERLKDKVFQDRDKFIEEVTAYAKLKRGEWSEKNIPLLGLGDKGISFMRNIDEKQEEKALSEEDIETILKNLTMAYEEYKGIQ